MNSIRFLYGFFYLILPVMGMPWLSELFWKCSQNKRIRVKLEIQLHEEESKTTSLAKRTERKGSKIRV